MSQLQLTAEQLAEMVGLIEDGTISGKIGKQILPDLLQVCCCSIPCMMCRGLSADIHMVKGKMRNALLALACCYISGA